MAEPTPPPERPLPDQARARIRADLLAQAREHRSAPRWLVPAGAAAAVALVAGLGYWAIDAGGSDPDSLPVTGGGTDTVVTLTPSSAVPSSLPSDGASSTPTPKGPGTISATAGTLPPGSDDAVQVGTGSCETELEFVLKGATLAVQVDDATSFWVKGDRFSLCYVMDGSTTVTHPLPLEPRDDVATYRVLSMFPPTDDGYQTVRVAGGVVPAGATAFDVQYTFPDSHIEAARTVTDDQGRAWWVMARTYAGPGGNEMNQPEIEVRVSLSGVQKRYTLQWAIDTCAQANHGC